MASHGFFTDNSDKPFSLFNAGLLLSRYARAGARRSIVTLRPIPDQQTAIVMAQFYHYLIEEGMGYAKAFLSTKRDVWAGRLEGVRPEVINAFVLYTN